eukprot:g10180.t1
MRKSVSCSLSGPGCFLLTRSGTVIYGSYGHAVVNVTPGSDNTSTRVNNSNTCASLEPAHAQAWSARWGNGATTRTCFVVKCLAGWRLSGPPAKKSTMTLKQNAGLDMLKRPPGGWLGTSIVDD